MLHEGSLFRRDGFFRGVRAPRRQGEVDTMDLVLGLVLLVLLPLFFYFGAGLLGFGSGDSKMREKPEVPSPAPDAAEVQLRWTTAAELYLRNGKDFMSMLSASEDQELRQRFLGWTLRCLENAKSQLAELEALIRAHPKAAQEFSAKLLEVADLGGQIDRDLARVRQQDVLGVYSRR